MLCYARLEPWPAKGLVPLRDTRVGYFSELPAHRLISAEEAHIE